MVEGRGLPEGNAARQTPLDAEPGSVCQANWSCAPELRGGKLRRHHPREEPSESTLTLGSARGAVGNSRPYRDHGLTSACARVTVYEPPKKLRHQSSLQGRGRAWAAGACVICRGRSPSK